MEFLQILKELSIELVINKLLIIKLKNKNSRFVDSLLSGLFISYFEKSIDKI